MNRRVWGLIYTSVMVAPAVFVIDATVALAMVSVFGRDLSYSTTPLHVYIMNTTGSKEQCSF